MPRNPIDSLQRFVALRTSLERERDSITKRLAEIERALGSAPHASAPVSIPAQQPRRGRPLGSKNKAAQSVGRRSTQNEMSMREAISKALVKEPLGIRDVVAAMQKLGYRFKSSNPANSVGAFLYGPEGKKTFVRGDGGKFSLRK